MRSTAMRLSVGMVLAALALGAPMLAEARVVRAPRCPTQRPQDGEHCPRVGMSCGFRGGQEGSRDAQCTCALDPSDHLVWTCEASGPVYGD